MFRFLVIVALPLFAVAELDDPVFFSAIKGSMNGNYIAFQAVIANNKVRELFYFKLVKCQLLCQKSYNAIILQADFTSSYGAFKVTSPGTYKFSFSAVSPEGVDLRISLRSNGIPVITGYSGGNSFETASGNMILTLEEGDIVYLFVEKGDIFESNKVNRAFTSFCGHQISAAKSKGMFSGLLGRNIRPTTNDILQTVVHREESDNLVTILQSNSTLISRHRKN